MIQHLRDSFSSGRTGSLKARLEILDKFESSLELFEDEFCQALAKDLGKSAAEAFNTEIGIVKYELAFALKKLKH